MIKKHYVVIYIDVFFSFYVYWQFGNGKVS